MAKATATKVKDSVFQTMSLPKVLYQRALKYEKEKGIKVTNQIRASLNDFLTHNNY